MGNEFQVVGPQMRLPGSDQLMFWVGLLGGWRWRSAWVAWCWSRSQRSGIMVSADSMEARPVR